MAEPRDCEFADLLAEVATGAASGPDRARVLRHLNTCGDCRRELEQLTRVADEVLMAAPVRESPAGFEQAVLDRIAAQSPAGARATGVRRWLRPVLAVAAAAVLAIGGAGVVWQATSDDRRLAAAYRDTLGVANGRYFAASDLVGAGGASAGTAFFYEGSPSWLYVVVRDAPAGTYDIAVSVDGRVTTVAECEVAQGTCGAGATLEVSIRSIDAVLLIAPDGTTLAATA
jgi:Putative zinc-finger